MIITIPQSSSSTRWTPRQARGLLEAMAVKEAERNLEKQGRGLDCSTGLTTMKGRGKKGGGIFRLQNNVAEVSTRLMGSPGDKVTCSMHLAPCRNRPVLAAPLSLVTGWEQSRQSLPGWEAVLDAGGSCWGCHSVMLPTAGVLSRACSRWSQRTVSGLHISVIYQHEDSLFIPYKQNVNDLIKTKVNSYYYVPSTGYSPYCYNHS